MNHRTAGLLFIALTALWLVLAGSSSRSPAGARIARVELAFAAVCLILAIYFLRS